ncbi:hypothetical protein ABZP36_007185 [Zizania latifolia]
MLQSGYGKTDKKNDSPTSPRNLQDDHGVDEDKEPGQNQNSDEDAALEDEGKVDIPKFGEGQSEDGADEVPSDDVDKLLLMLEDVEQPGDDGQNRESVGSRAKLDKDKQIAAENLHLAIVPLDFKDDQHRDDIAANRSSVSIDSPIMGVVQKSVSEGLVEDQRKRNVPKIAEKKKL